MSHEPKGMNHESGIRRYLPWVLLWGMFFALYAATTVRDVLPADSGEFQLAAAIWDILHPPGYPLYTVVGALWVHLAPLGSLAFRLNLLSAVLAASTLTLTARAVAVWTETWGLTRRAALTGGIAAALLLGSSPTFWAQATTANIRMPTLLFGAWAFLALAQYRRELAEPQRASRALLSLAVALGLGVGHHPSLIFIALGWALYLLLLDPALLRRPRRWWKAAPVAALAWGIPQLYLPLRGAAIEGLQLATPGLNTWAGFWHHVLARGFSGDMFAFANAADLSLRLPLLGPLFRFQFPLLALIGILAAWVWLLLRQRRVALALGASWLLHTFVTLTYRAPQTVEYLMPAYLPMVLVFGMGIAELARWRGVTLRQPGRLNPIPALILALLVLRIMGMTPDFLTLAADTSIRERVAPLLEQAPPDALILADWHWATPLWMLQRTEGLGAGAEVAYVYPRANEDYEQVWRAWAESAQGRPLFSTHAYDWSEWTAAPVGGGYRLFPRPLTALPPELGYTPLEAELGPVRLLGYRIAGMTQGEAVVQQGTAIEVQLAWQASGAQEPVPSLTARLFDAQGGFLINADRWLGSDAAAGEVRFTNLTLQLPLNACTETLIPNVGVYTVDANGFNALGETNLPALAMRCGGSSLPVAHFKPGLVLWSGPFLCGADTDSRDSATVYLHWCGPGRGLRVQSGEAQAVVAPLGLGERQTIALPVAVGTGPTFALTRLDGAPARLLAAPFAQVTAGELYIPFGNAMALTGATLKERGGMQVVDLHWRGARPLVEDYAVSVRLLAGETFLGMHDMQPALSTIPTLKWVATGAEVMDPHPFELAEQQATHATIAVYERFRLTPVGEAASIALR